MGNNEHAEFIQELHARVNATDNITDLLEVTDKALQEYLDKMEEPSEDREDRLETRLLYIVTSVGKACDFITDAHHETRTDPIMSEQQKLFHDKVASALIGITTALKGVSVRMEKDRHG